MKKLLSLILVVGLVFCFTACKKGKDSVPNESQTSEIQSESESSGEGLYEIEIKQSEYTVREDQTVLITATVNPDAVLQWSTNDTSVLSLVAKDGGVSVLGKKAGSATVTASCGNDFDSCVVTVLPSDGETVVVESEESEYAVELNGADVNLNFGAFVLSADGSKTQIDNAKIEYSISNGKLVTLTNGVLKGKRHGKLEVTATYSGSSVTVPVVVYDKFISDTTEWKNMILNAQMGEYYMLDADIDFNGVTYTSFGADASAGKTGAFRATLNGKNYSVKNITLDGQSASYVSIFGKLYNAKISNISFENVKLKGQGAKGAGLASSIDGKSAIIKNVYLDLSFEDVPTSAGVLVYNCFAGSIESVIAMVKTPTSNAKNDNVSVVKSVTGTISGKGVYVLASGEIVSVSGLNGYTSKIDMAWDINDEKLLDVNSWNYVGGVDLPTLK